MCEIKTDKKQLNKYLMNAALFGIKTIPKDRDDFGGDTTVGMHLRRRGKSIETFNLFEDFARYLGVQGGKWIVAIKDPVGKPVAYQEFATEGEMKQVWELD